MLHMHSDEECHKILKNCHQALPDNGKVIVIQCPAGDPRVDSSSARFSPDGYNHTCQLQGRKGEDEGVRQAWQGCWLNGLPVYLHFLQHLRSRVYKVAIPVYRLGLHKSC
uniref:O-methyltransferase C-terminal domain-containing protein n=1 Tax=Arundo donax TaxID=35708 RepID=A0A0A8YE35_ARUDO